MKARLHIIANIIINVRTYITEELLSECVPSNQLLKEVTDDGDGVKVLLLL